ncbi:MAG: MBL fold metallo-hydrolase [Planctomycetota bacterium]|jgi:hydroxyacylglutathione hydrolase
MLWRLVYDEDLAQGAYLVGCQKTREAVVFDPERDVDRYIELAKSHGLRITAVAETHIHADFLSGARELAERVGAHVYVSGLGGDDWQSKWVGPYPHTILGDGDAFDIGNIHIVARHTPGHTPEHLVFLVEDRGGGASEAMGAITGDFMFVGDLGRPDLLESAAGLEGVADGFAHDLYRTTKSFMSQPDHLQIWPAHGSGSACGKALGAVPQSTMGYERRFNPMLKLVEDERAFVENILAGQPEPPVYFARMKAWNRDGVPLLGEVPSPRPLEAGEIPALLATGAIPVDVRPQPAFVAAHLPGSLWAPPGPAFLMAVGSYVEPDQSVVLVCEAGQVDRFVRNLVRIGLDKIVGWIDAATLEAHLAGGGAHESIPEIDVEELASRLEAAPDLPLLDVRRASEHAAGAIDGAVNVAHTRLFPRLAEVPAGDPIVVHCQGGTRSTIAAAALKRKGRQGPGSKVGAST